MSCNRVEIEGSLTRLEALRHTPAGVPIIQFHIEHQSEQIEAGGRRLVSCQLPAIALGKVAEQLIRAGEGTQVRVTGFLAMKSLKSIQLVLHVTSIEFS